MGDRRRLIIRGPFRGYSGYDVTTRNLARAIARRGVKLGLIDIPQWSPLKLKPDARDLGLDRLDRDVDASVILHLCPPTLALISTQHWNANLTMFEATKVPDIWALHSRYQQLTVVPTQSSRDAWSGAGFPAGRVYLSPLGVDIERFRPGLPPLDICDRDGRGITDYRVRVLNVSTLDHRKNLFALLAVWLRATSREDDAILVVKLSPVDRLRLMRFLRDVKLLEGDIGRAREEAAPIVFLDREMADEEMPELYAACTHYWSMSFGEGWDQPMTEAGASGLQLIAPDHSAYRAYLDSGVASMIPAEQVPADRPHDAGHQELFGGAEWWRPSEAVAEVLVGAAVRGDMPVLSARERLSGFTWDAAAGRLLEVLSEVEPSLAP
jgi:glycosyltransferase involved in cell wall biosynthesis